MDKPITLNVSPAQLHVIATALHQRPYIEVAPLLADLERQVLDQQIKNQTETATASNQPPGQGA